MDHLEKCFQPLSNPKPLDPPMTQFGEFQKQNPPSCSDPPTIPKMWIPVKSPRKLEDQAETVSYLHSKNINILNIISPIKLL